MRPEMGEGWSSKEPPHPLSSVEKEIRENDVVEDYRHELLDPGQIDCVRLDGTRGRFFLSRVFAEPVWEVISQTIHKKNVACDQKWVVRCL